MIPPLFLRVYVKEKGKRRFCLWLPLFLLWALLLLLFIILLPFIVVAGVILMVLGKGGFLFGICLGTGRLICALRGLRVSVDSGDTKVLVSIQ